MDSIPSLASPRLYGGVSFYLFICLLCSVSIGGAFSTAIAADKVIFSWRANPQGDNVLGYRLYFGARSRFDGDGGVKSGFSYASYYDFTDSQRCLLTDSGPVCESYTDDEVDCEGLYGETPRCTLYNLEGRHYFAMTAYNAQYESDYTEELSNYLPPKNLAILQQVYSLLRK